MRTGVEERVPYSLSRWTDVPGAKWDWFKAQLAAGQMVAVDPRNAVPYRWSLRPEDTLGLVFWTKNPTNLVRDYALIEPYRTRVHVTITGWEEVEPGVPNYLIVAGKTAMLADRIGRDRIEWRFSPVPLLSDLRVPRRPDAGTSLAGMGLLDRFERIGRALSGYVGRVYLSFLQPNDRMPETRTAEERLGIMRSMAEIAAGYGMQVHLCNEDRTLLGASGLPSNLSPSVCAPPEDFALPGAEKPASEGCGCVLMVDPFTVNESCTMGCQYCYAADQQYAPKKMNTTRTLPVVR